MVRNNKKIKILFMVECVTLAHLTRSFTLAKGLDSNLFEVSLAVSEVPQWLNEELSKFNVFQLNEFTSSALFIHKIAEGKLPYSNELIERQIQEDIKIIKNINPDIVVGDMRLSLRISSQLAKVPFVQLTNVTWHPDIQLEPIIPEVPLVQWTGHRLGSFIFKLLKPIIYKSLARPFISNSKENRVLKIPKNLAHVYVDGDLTIFADVPCLVKGPQEVMSQCIGPIYFNFSNTEKDNEILNTLERLPKDRPWVLVSMGSSGQKQIVPSLIRYLSQLKIVTVVATSSKDLTSELELNENQIAFDFLPLEKVMNKFDLLIHQGGSPVGYMGLKYGIPLLAIPSNLDQLQFSTALVKAGVSKIIRLYKLKNESKKGKLLFQQTVQDILENKIYSENAKQFQKKLLTIDSVKNFESQILKFYNNYS